MGQGRENRASKVSVGVCSNGEIEASSNALLATFTSLFSFHFSSLSLSQSQTQSPSIPLSPVLVVSNLMSLMLLRLSDTSVLSVIFSLTPPTPAPSFSTPLHVSHVGSHFAVPAGNCRRKHCALALATANAGSTALPCGHVTRRTCDIHVKKVNRMLRDGHPEDSSQDGHRLPLAPQVGKTQQATDEKKRKAPVLRSVVGIGARWMYVRGLAACIRLCRHTLAIILGTIP